MWVRGVIGVVLVIVGGVWIGQGVGAIKGSMMSGHGGYAALGGVAVAIGLVMIVWAARVRRQDLDQAA